ncbi:MAG: hypothetical protein LBK94_06460 [Prevotellaceae bacterium]|jgi:hypothetical protein|nr:hypothetical protein [Prevotellaceae bacterium]
MKQKIKSIITNTHGVFISCTKKNKLTSDIRQTIVYLGVENDKKNIRNDMFNLSNDFKKSVEAAKSKLKFI